MDNTPNKLHISEEADTALFTQKLEIGDRQVTITVSTGVTTMSESVRNSLGASNVDFTSAGISQFDINVPMTVTIISE